MCPLRRCTAFVLFIEPSIELFTALRQQYFAGRQEYSVCLITIV